MTDGFEVFVQLVIAAMTTEPCSRSNVSPPIETGTALCSGSASATATGSGCFSSSVSLGDSCPGALVDAGSLAGNVSAISLSGEPFRYGTPKLESDSRKDDFASVSGTRSCGRRGPARLGSTSPRSSSITCEYSGVWSGSWKRPCARQYASTSSTCSALRPVSRM